METKYNTQSVQMHILEDLTIENQSEHEDIWNVLDNVTPSNATASSMSSKIQNYLKYPRATKTSDPIAWWYANRYGIAWL